MTQEAINLEDIRLGAFGARSRPSRLRQAGDLARNKPIAALGLIIIALLVICAALAPVIATHDPNVFDGYARLSAPSSSHWLGTDQNGRDVFSRIVYGARVSVGISFGAIAICVLLATTIGVVSGYFGSWVDGVTQRFVDAAMAFPWLIVLITLVAVLGAGVWQVVAALGVVSCFGMSRVIRSAVLGIKAQPFIEACLVMGASPWRIMLRHIVPNILPVVIISATVSMGGLVLAEASLSFLGFGVPPPAPSWGAMLSVDGRAFMERAPWLALAPGVAIGAIVFSFNMVGDGLRDVLDPRLRL